MGVIGYLFSVTTVVLFLCFLYSRIKLQKIKDEKDKEYLQKIIASHEEEVLALDRTLERHKEQLKEKFEITEKNFENEIVQLKLETKEKKSIIEEELKEYAKKREAVIEDTLRQREMKEKENFYKIQLSQDDIDDIKILASVAKRFSRKELIPKLIWDSIASRPAQEMIKRVAANKEGGIYKITFIPTGEVYIGRTTNFQTRFKAHVQTALGMEKAATSTLHTHMAANGFWNYTFEILEECPKEKQNEREKFYIDLYQSKKQLNMKGGG